METTTQIAVSHQYVIEVSRSKECSIIWLTIDYRFEKNAIAMKVHQRMIIDFG